ncbi:sensor histidine kinase [Alkalibacter mobilis]|uniref:sensor histidine kinase n=1 Tax=Alkalibacter mobilis TaxID=2787712 RepID=UPI00189E9020|nr:sensor histidine kinase [Alkalibacter mobilis]MBF7097692.1 GHKL domain-containing protein [Alkalibacter mobilis]
MRVKLIIAVFIVIFSFITELITAMSFGLLFGASIQGVRDNPMHLFLGSVVSKILLILLIEVVIRFRRRKASNVSLSSWLLILSIPLVSVVLAVISVYQPVINNTFDDLGVIACLSIVYINLMAFYLFDNIIVQTDENNQFRFKEEQLLLQQNQYKNIIAGYDQVKRIRHDMLGHLITISGYLKNSQIKKAMDYIKEIHSDLDLSNQGIISTNVAVDAIINNRSSKAKKLGIGFEHEIMIANNMQINDVDLCIILGNALNNAIEACQRIDGNIPKKIDVKLKYKRNSLLIEVKNPCDCSTIKMRNGLYLSSKPYRATNSIGTGIGNIKSVVEKYRGLCEMDFQSDIFLFRAVIPDVESGI